MPFEPRVMRAWFMIRQLTRDRGPSNIRVISGVHILNCRDMVAAMMTHREILLLTRL